MSGPNVVLSIPADSYQWGPLRRGVDSCFQEATLMAEGKFVCKVIVEWPMPLPTVPVVCHTDGRASAPHD